ncbi:cytidine deaminase [Photobacterium sanguinicancri]|uniref:Cytidine deaminase n=1 Tax=Photobacterium sanguinicancri TaxID=875932 RepID=A0AAW7Y868_9GAMM|nr:cytidine deaminase [Photobacterium sanguinicancri]KXI23529.1 cytidine deaminase [Photobacterium sanguinicancri]MDO6543941.1 cytidine deaminase [Photobacterium sanguinicancri]OZS42731.1 cytidine deaminase [Photobacterium sanguinicancri]
MHTKVMDALGSLPADLATAIKPMLEDGNFDATISAEQFDNLLSQTHMTDSELRVALLPLAATYSVSPLSHFCVGAVVRGNSGRLYFGGNMEFVGAALSQTVHAEQSAISHAWVKGETGVKDITINYSPCGHCRQFMNELSTADTIKVQLPEREEKTLQQYLPESFGPSDLGITERLLTEINHGLGVDEESELVQAACQAANRAHAPYTKNFSGVALKTDDGRIFVGMYAENAAFNPSLPPLQVALINMNMAGYELSRIIEAALVEQSSSISHLADTQNTLEALNPDIPLTYSAL